MNPLALSIIAGILMIPGVIGVLMPVLPGIPYMFLIALAFGFIDKFVTLSVTELVYLLVIALISIIIDYFSGLIGSRYGGASRYAMALGIIGLIIGLFAFPPFGGLIGLFIGIFIGEIVKFKDQAKALKAAFSGLVGSITGIVLNTILAILFLVLFLIFTI